MENKNGRRGAKFILRLTDYADDQGRPLHCREVIRGRENLPPGFVTFVGKGMVEVPVVQNGKEGLIKNTISFAVPGESVQDAYFNYQEAHDIAISEATKEVVKALKKPKLILPPGVREYGGEE